MDNFDIENGENQKLYTFDQLDYKDSVNDKKSKIGNLIGWIDYHDRYYSRKFSMIDSNICNFIFCPAAWIFNRWQCVLQIPIVFLLVWAYPQKVNF